MIIISIHQRYVTRVPTVVTDDSLTKMLCLQNDHPIYRFLDRRRKLTPLLPLSTQTQASLPLVCTLVGQHPDVGHSVQRSCSTVHRLPSKLKVEIPDFDGHSQRVVEKTSGTQQKPKSQTRSHSRSQRSPSVIVISPPCPRQINSITRQVKKEEKIEDIDHLSLSDSSDDVPIPHHVKFPATPTRPQAPLIIDLCSPEMKPAVSITRQVHPQKIALKKDKKIENVDHLLSLSDSDDDVKPIAHSSHHIKLFATPMKPQAPLVIDLCLPEMKPTVRRGSVVEAPGVVRVGSVYPSLEAAQEAIYAQENRLGHVWRRGQGTKSNDGSQKKMTFRCNHYHHPTPTHSPWIDPSDHRRGKSIKTDCKAHVNVNRIQYSTSWHVTLANWDHNHEREIPVGGTIRRSATLEQRKVVAELATSSGNFNCKQISSVLTSRFSATLEPRQIGNIITKARQEAREAVASLGGDVAAIIASLQKKIDEEHGWKYDLKLNNSQTVTGIWWQSPLQAELTKRFSDVLINDNTYNRNNSGYPLNVGVVIDNTGTSRNAWYALHATEDLAHHNWVLRCHLDSAGGVHPEVFASDRSQTLISSVEATLPLTDHIYCLHHLDGNVTTNLRGSLGTEWSNFQHDFWAAYRAVSPEEFDRLWKHLVSRYPSTQAYLDAELFPSRERWAWAWVSFKFTAGVRTNGRVEAENRVNKSIGGPKTGLKQLFDRLNERTNGQRVNEMIRVREVCKFLYSGRQQNNMYSAVVAPTTRPQHRICLHRTPQNSSRPCRTLRITNMLQADGVINVLQNRSLAAP